MTSRETALRVLQEVDGANRKSEEILNYLLDQSNLGRNDRALARELVSGTLKYRLQCDFIISHFYRHDYAKAAPVLKNILRLGVYQLMHLDRVPVSAAVNECVKLARKFKGDHLSRLVNGLLRKITPESVSLYRWTAKMAPAERLSIVYSCPPWLVERWIATYGESRTESMLISNNLPPATGYRINRLKAKPVDLFALPTLSGATRLENELGDFFFSQEFTLFEPLLKEGLVSVQNPSQGLACILADPAPGSTVYDMCAAPGGKATFMAELMNNSGRIIAIDRSSRKVARLVSNADALGITIIEAHEGDALTFDPECRPDTILLDAPCTGTGVLGRRAELRWRCSPEKLLELVALQISLLDRAAELLRPGGTLLYATCSLEPEENEHQTAAFLQRHPDFSIEKSILTLPGEPAGFDGAYAVRLVKKGM